MQSATYTVSCKTMDRLSKLLGIYDENLNLIARELGVTAFTENTDIIIKGEQKNAELCSVVLNELLDIISSGEPLDKTRIIYCIEMAREGNTDGIEKVMSGVVAVTSRGKQIKCKTLGQKKYVEAIKKNSVVFGVGPAGTGKTYLAVALAVTLYKAHEVEKIILTRPAVEAGEKLGFLPGDMKDKIDPYLQPLYDALEDMIPPMKLKEYMETNVIQIAPLAFMRGRTLNDAMVVLDEAQNTTTHQIKMFLTRLGMGSKMIVTGDVTQIDLPRTTSSGLIQALKILRNVKGIGKVEFEKADIVRHHLVQRIVEAYERFDKEEQQPHNE